MPKLTVEVSEKLDNAIDQIAEQEALTKSQVVRQSLALYKVLEEERRRGRKLVIADENDKPLKEIVPT